MTLLSSSEITGACWASIKNISGSGLVMWSRKQQVRAWSQAFLETGYILKSMCIWIESAKCYAKDA